MRFNLHLLFVVGVIVFLFGSCAQKETLFKEELAEKCAPYEWFAFQRSYPDASFDGKGWRNALKAVRTDESVRARRTGCETEYTPQWTEQGPANVGARCNTLAAKPDDENTVLAGFAGGGIFKTTDGGLNWYPVFDNQPELSIGDITFDPIDPNVVYAGTGDPNVPAIAYNGNGLYKSLDAGETWTYVGLSEQGVISKVVINPADHKTLIVATMGNPYVRNHERGIYRSTDGGATWTQTLFVSEQAGASDLVMSPANPNIMYASFWDRIRNNHESVIYGSHAKVYKSVDGGITWNVLSGGLPTGTLGRTGLAISQQNPNKVYAVYIDSLSTPQGLYKTTDGGSSWTSVNISSLEDACGDFGWYFGKIRLSPTNDDDIYFLAILLWRKPAGSNSWVSAGGGHADCHDLIFTPSGRRYWSNDGGVYFNNPGQMFWTKCKNLPVTQFYHTTYNPHDPNIYWGGSQDNGVQKGSGGPTINNWTSVFSADGFRCAFHPDDPKTFWVEIQNGTIHKTVDGGDSWQFGTTALGSSDRCNWDAPFFMSRFNSGKLYSATYRAYFSDGNGWSPISGDLTDGPVFEPRFHTVSCLNESPLIADKLIAGTSDGNVWIRQPVGSWINVTGNLPNRYVTSVVMSPANGDRLFVTHSGFRDNEVIPHVHRSDNNGAAWVDISGDLPQVPVNDIYILPGHADSVLFVATDAGVYFTKNGGQHWSRLGSNMPVIPVFDLEENPVRRELVAATFARGIWTMPFDSILAQQPAVLVNISGAVTTEMGDGVVDVQFGAVKSQSTGQFMVGNVPGCTAYTLAPYRNDNPLNGVTTYDLYLINRHILGIESLNSPYKMIAADANKSNNITTFDIVALRKLILGIDTVLAGNTSWRFIPQNFVFSNPLNPFTSNFPEAMELSLSANAVSGVQFTGIKVGDVNNTVTPNAAPAPDDRSTGAWPIVSSDPSFQPGEKVELTIEGDPAEIAALQFSLQFDPGALHFEEIIPLAAPCNSGHFGLKELTKGRIDCALEFPADQYFKMVFTARKAGKASDFLRLSAGVPAMAFRHDGTALRPALWEMAAPVQLTISPNPFGKEGTSIAIDGRGAETLTLELFDLQGRRTATCSIQTGQTLRLTAAEFPHAGVYIWRIRETAQTGKLVFVP